VWQLGLATLWFFGFAFVVGIGLNIVFAAFGAVFASDVPVHTMLPASAAIYMLVMGIIMPQYLELVMNHGATRKQHALGLLGAGIVMSCLLTIICAIVATIFGDFDVSVAVHGLLVSFSCFMTGWVIVLGYQLRRVFAAFLTTLFGIVMFGLVPQQSSGTPGLTYLFGGDQLIPIASSMAIPINLLACLALFAIILALTRRIAIKV
jgi:hypothetical protein